MKTPEQRGPIGTWARNERERKNWKLKDVLDALHKQGLRINDSSYRGIESGARRPGAEVLAALEKAFGSQAPRPRQADSGEILAALAAQTEAITAQTQAINALVARLEMMTEVQQGQTDGLLQAVSEVVGAQRLGGQLGESPQLPSPGVQP